MEQIIIAAINCLSQEVHEIAYDKGWWDQERSFGEIISLIHSELSEALEEYRNGHSANEIYTIDEKPEGIPIELADTIIRILDYCGKENINIGSAIYQKLEYNKSRPIRHGGKKI